MRPITIILGVAVILLGTFFYATGGFRPGAKPKPLPQLWTVGDFTLTERSGQPFQASALQGKVWVADLFYTSCPGTCPMLSSRLSEVHKAVAEDEAVRLVSISGDPEKDTPTVLRQYATKFGANERWLFLTGSRADVQRLAQQGLKLALQETPGGEEPVTHSSKLILIDKHGRARGSYNGVGEDQSRELLADIQRLKQEP